MLKDLYFGEISPWERERECVRTCEYKDLVNKTIAIGEYFKSLLSSEEYAKLEEMKNLQAQIDLIESPDLFEYAFRTGALMMIDIFCCDGNN